MLLSRNVTRIGDQRDEAVLLYDGNEMLLKGYR